MSRPHVELEGIAFDRRRDALAAELAARAPMLVPEPGAPATFVLPAEPGRLRIRIVRVDAPGAFARFATVALAYRIEGGAPRDADRVRKTLIELAARLAELDAPEPSSGSAPISGDDFAVRAESVASAYRASIEAWWKSPTSHDDVSAPCLSIAQRPPFDFGESRAVPETVGTSCRTCAVLDVCPAPVAPDARTPPRALRHRDRAHAAHAGARVVASAFDAPVPQLVTETIDALVRDTPRGAPATPFELSLKARGSRLEPSLRIVEYAARPTPGSELGASRDRRFASIERIASAALAPELLAPFRSFTELVRTRAPMGVETSLGLDVSLLDEQALVQVYAHLDSVAAGARGPLVLDALRASGVGEAAVESFHDLLRTPDASVTLLAFAPSSREPSRLKVYVAAPLSATHAPTGLVACDTGPFAGFSPSHGLAVFETRADALVLRKWDFPNTAHFQVAEASVRAFTHGLDPTDGRRAHAILLGDELAAWPTWLSVAPGMRTYYFVPR